MKRVVDRTILVVCGVGTCIAALCLLAVGGTSERPSTTDDPASSDAEVFLPESAPPTVVRARFDGIRATTSSPAQGRRRGMGGSAVERALELDMKVDPGSVYQVQASDDLKRWETLLGMRADGKRIVFTDPDHTNFPVRFYRSVLLDGVTDDLPPWWSAGSEMSSAQLGYFDLRLRWDAAKDDTGVASYTLYRDGRAVSSVLGNILETHVERSPVAPSHEFRVEARDAFGNVSDEDLVTRWVALATTVITNPTHIAETNLNYENDTLVIDGTTVTLDGVHAFANLVLTNGAVLTHSVGQSNGLSITVAGSVVVNSNCVIHADSAGNLPVGTATGHSGGSYGGRGEDMHGVSNPTYGSYLQPRDLGAGGRSRYGRHTRGGGAICITAAECVLQGGIRANGGTGSSEDGGGAGGSIWLSLGAFRGGGAIQANAGAETSNAGAGGGGRVAVYYDVNTFDISRIQCKAVSPGGGAGTIYLRDNAQPEGLLRIDNTGTGTSGSETDLVMTGNTVGRIELANSNAGLSGDSLFDSVAMTGAVLTVRSRPWTIAGDLLVDEGSALTHGYGDTNGAHLVIGGRLSVSSNSAVHADSRGLLPDGGVTGHSGGSYGGCGEAMHGSSNPLFGSYPAPTDLGMGGRSRYGRHTRGGGALRIDAAECALAGQIRSVGGTGSSEDGGGSGGSIWLSVGTLSGAGSILANGGQETWNAGAGGGGRIALYYDDVSGFDLARIQNRGTSSGGGAGTIYLKDNAQPQGILRVDNTGHGTAGGETHETLVSNTVQRIEIVNARAGVAGDDVSLDSIVMTGGILTVKSAPWAVTGDVVLEDGAALTHDAGNSNGLHLVIAGTLSVSSNSAVHADSAGLYPTGVTGHSGGSYGGWGESMHGSANSPFGDYLEPINLGVGGRARYGNHTRGGGLVRIEVGQCVLDGQVRANGGNGPSEGGGGSGGSIWLSAGTFSGSGSIHANGGAEGYNAGGGGGGRVAVYYGDGTGFDLTRVEARATSVGAAPGTIYLRDTDDAQGTIRVANSGVGTGGSETHVALQSNTVSRIEVIDARAGLVGDNVFDSLFMTGGVLTAKSSPWTFTGDVVLDGGGSFGHDAGNSNGLHLLVNGTVSVGSNAVMDVSGRGSYATTATGRSGGSYGGRGEGSSGSSDPTFGDVLRPLDLGRGGVGDNRNRGGGLIWIEATTLHLDGWLRSNGAGPGYRGGGGSGGSILVDAGTITGTGGMQADGSTEGQYAGGGGGGRIAIYASDLGVVNRAQLHARGSSTGGGAGTVYVRDTDEPSGQLRMNNANRGTYGATPITLDPGDVDDMLMLDDAQAAITLTAASSFRVIVATSAHVSVVGDTTVDDMDLGGDGWWYLSGALGVTNDLTIRDTASLSQVTGYSNGVRVAVDGRMAVHSNASVDVSSRGDYATTATGRSGGSYGGRGEGANNGSSEPTFGSMFRPRDLGRGGVGDNWNRGGGAIWIETASLHLDGWLRSNGAGPGYRGGGGSGGSILVDAGTITGTGGMQADGSTEGQYAGGGGGGRIAVYASDLGAINRAQLHARGSSTGGGAGTVYVRDTDEPSGQLRMNNANRGTYGDTLITLDPGDVDDVLMLDDAQATVTLSAASSFRVVAATNAHVTVVGDTYVDDMDLGGDGWWYLSGALLVTNDLTIRDAASLSQVSGYSNGVHVVVDGRMTVHSNASVNVSGRGAYATTATGRSGGSYGGRGEGANNGSSEATFGSMLRPRDLGRGGVGDNWNRGGGAIWLEALELHLDGWLFSDGAGPGYRGGGGSGGSILVDAGTITGSGGMQADGNIEGQYAGGGGGGRIAVYASELGALDCAKLIARGSSTGGGAGTVYVRDTDEVAGQLRMNNENRGSVYGSTTIALAGDEIDDVLMLNDANAALTLSNAASLVVIASTSAVVSVSGDIGVESVALGGDGWWYQSGAFVVSNDFDLLDSASLSHGNGYARGLHVEVGRRLTVASNAALNVSSRGNYPNGQVTGRSGGSYGGRGEAANGGNSNPTYGDYREPRDLGTGGIGDNWGRGGGFLWVEAPEIVLDGAFLSDGQDGPYRGGGGSGGSVLVDVDTLNGTGIMRARGGVEGQYSGGGGGGRIAVYYVDASGFNLTNNISSPGSVAGGGVGTVYLGDKSDLPFVAGSRPAEGQLITSTDTLIVQFSRPMNVATFDGNDDCVLSGPGGRIAATGMRRSSPLSYFIGLASPLSDGTHTLTVGPGIEGEGGSAMDQNTNGVPGEPTDVYTISFEVDATPPATPVVTNFLASPAWNDITNATAQFMGTREDDSSVYLNGALRVGLGSGPWQTPQALVQGSNVIAVYAMDLAGNTSVYAYVNLYCDSILPVVNWIVPAHNAYTTPPPANVTIGFTDETSGLNLADTQKEITRNGVPVAGAWSATSNRVTFVPVTTFAEGVYTNTLRLRDNLGNWSAPFHTRFTVDLTVPEPRITGPAVIDENATTNGVWYGTYTASSSSDNYGIHHYEWDFGDGTPGVQGTTIHHGFVGYRTNYAVVLTAQDLSGLRASTTQIVTTTGNELPVPAIVADTTTVEGRVPVTLNATNSTDDFGVYTYLWRFPPRHYRFDGQVAADYEWRIAGNVSWSEELVLSGDGTWGNTYAYTRQTSFERGAVLEARIDTASGYQICMIGFKNASDSGGNYNQWVHGLDFADGTVRVYENGSELAIPKSYTKGKSYEVRIESVAPAGARYYMREAGEASYEHLYTSSNLSNALLKFGVSLTHGTFVVNDVRVDRAVCSLDEITTTLDATGDVVLEARDHALQVNSTALRISLVPGAPPVARISGPSDAAMGADVLFSAADSTDDVGISRYEWDFGDGATFASGGPDVSHHYTTTGVFRVAVTVYDRADQSSTAFMSVNVTYEGLVQCVPWRFVNEIEIPHETWHTNDTVLKAVAAHAALPFTYVWNFGDGSATVTGSVSTTAAAYGIQATHQYQGSVGTPYFATISIYDDQGKFLDDDVYPVLLKKKNIDTEMNVAIDNGLWWLHKMQRRYNIDADTLGGYWEYTVWGPCYVSPSASAVQAFHINGHRETGDASRDPYVETARRGINWLLTTLHSQSIGSTPYGEPDSNGNGIGISCADQRPPYQLGQIMDAIVAGGAPDTVARVGRVDVAGRTYRELVQDMADMYAWGQSDNGGWRYAWNDNPDNSACQWGAIGLLAAEQHFHTVVPQWVKDRNKVWIQQSRGGRGYGYTSGGDGEATTPSALVQVSWNGTPTTNFYWTHGEDFIADNWGTYSTVNNVYANYAIAKAMRTAIPLPVFTLRKTGKDWYLDETNGLARVTLNRQYADGHWIGSGRSYDQDDELITAWSVIMLSSSLFVEGPVAVVDASPNPAAVGHDVVFDASQSYHQHSSFDIIEYRWDFDASDGVDFNTPDAVGEVVTHAFPNLRDYTVTLLVKDNNSPAAFDHARVKVNVSIPPHPPSADGGGPYVTAIGEELALDGSGSFDIDAPDGDFITAWDWEIDFVSPHDFDDGVTGETVTVPGFFAEAGNRTIGLRVTDNTAAIYSTTNLPLDNLTDHDFVTVHVYESLIDDLVLRPKGGKCQLVWSKKGDEAGIYRSELGPNRGFVELARTRSDYATYLDAAIDENKDYWYRIYVFIAGETHPVGVSPAAYMRSRERERNREPRFTTRPGLAARVGILYEYDADALDREGDPITYSLVTGPTGMTVVASNGLLQFTPELSQLGEHAVTLAAADPTGQSQQNYQLVVFPATNHPPTAEANGPYEVVLGNAIAFDSTGTSDPDGDALRYLWNFGDGNTSTQAAPNYAYTAGGDYLVSLFVNDGYGGTTSDTCAVTIEIPNRNPVAVIQGGPTFTRRLGESLALDGSGSYDYDGDTLSFTWSWGDGSPDDTGADTAVHTYAGIGTYSGSLVATDGRGGVGTSAFTAIVGAANQPPTATFSIAQPGTNMGDRFVLDASATTDPEGDPLTYEWDFGDQTITTGIGVSHVFRRGGNFTVRLTVRDNHAGIDVATTNVHVNASPEFLTDPPLTVRQGELYNYFPNVVDADHNPLRFELPEGPLGMLMDPADGKLSWIPGQADVGDHAVMMRAVDTHGASTEQSFTLRVIDVNDPPTFVSTPPPNAGVGRAYVYQPRAVDGDGDAIAFALDAGPNGMTMNGAATGLIEWTPGGGQTGSHPVVILAEDARGGVGTQAFSVAVGQTSEPPTADAGTNQTVYVGERATLRGDGSSDPESDPLGYRWAVVSRPAGSTAGPPLSNEVSFVIMPDLPGEYVMQLIVDDGTLWSAPDTVGVTALLPPTDLAPVGVDASMVAIDSQSLVVSGTGTVTIANLGLGGSLQNFEVMLFEDVDFDHAYSSGVDQVLGLTAVGAVPDPVGNAVVSVAVSGQMLFKDNLVFALVDSSDAVDETNEDNNLARSLAGSSVVDLSASFLRVDRTALPGSAGLIARLGNCGDQGVGMNVAVSFYVGHPTNANVIGTARSTTALDPGEFEDVTVTWSGPVVTNYEIYVQADDVGTNVGEIVEVDEANNLFGTSINLAVNRAPVADAGPDRDVLTGFTIGLNGRGSSDADGDALTYQWTVVSIPAASLARLDDLSSDGPRFLADAEGDYVFDLVVNDGTTDSAADRITVTARDPRDNEPPEIASTPSSYAMVTVPYTYQVVATDPESDPLTYSLRIAPDGMSITPDGLVSWTPSNAVPVSIQADVTDDRGARDSQWWVVIAHRYQNVPPEIISDPPYKAEIGSNYAYQVEATDFNSDPLTYELVSAPAGMTIDTNSGLIGWVAASNQLGGHAVEVLARDPGGLTDSQAFRVVAVVDSEKSPVVDLIPDQTVFDPTPFAAIQLDNYVDDPDHNDDEMTWSASGQSSLVVTIDSNRVATVIYAPGSLVSELVTFVAEDPDGYIGFATARLTARGPDRAPIAVMQGIPDTGTTTIRDGLYELYGTADDPDYPLDDVSYKVSLFMPDGTHVRDVTPRPVDGSGYHRGRVPAGGSLGALDFTMVRNGTYVLRLAVKGGSRLAFATGRIAVNAKLKVGRFTFSERDAVMSVRGVPLTVIRTYDSLKPDVGDFGHGWTYSVADIEMEMAETRANQRGVFGETFSMRVGGTRDVTLNMPDTGERVTFKFSLPQTGWFRYTAQWRPPAGIHARLEPTCDATYIGLSSGVQYWQAAGPDTDSENFDFPGFILTTQDGSRYRIDRENLGTHSIDSGTAMGNYVQAYGDAHVSRIETTSGDELRFERDSTGVKAVHQYDANNNRLRSIVFTRDANDRIIALYDANSQDVSGNPDGPATVTYVYASDNLVRVNRLVDADIPRYVTTTYAYENPDYPHYITSITGPGGASPSRVLYDESGRMVGMVDPDGNEIRFDHNIGSQTETVYDKEGNATLYVYDRRGNVTAVMDALGNMTQRSYDGLDQVMSVTDPLGRTTQFGYDPSGFQTSITDALGGVTKRAYTGAGRVIAFTTPEGEAFARELDAAGNVTANVDAMGNRWENEFDGHGNQTAARDPDGNMIASMTYASDGGVTSIRSASGVLENLERDANGDLKARQYAWVNPEDSNDVRTIRGEICHDSMGRITSYTDTRGRTDGMAYDTRGRPSSYTDFNGRTSRTVYDGQGRRIALTTDDGACQRFVYDANGRAVVEMSQSHPEALAVGKRYHYDAVGRKVATELLSGPLVSIVTNAGVASSIFLGADDVLAVESNVYDAAGQLVESVNALGARATYEYDAAGRVTGVVNTVGARIELGYDRAGRRTFARDTLGREHRFSYDGNGRHNRTLFPDGTEEGWGFDSGGEITVVTDRLDRVTFRDFNALKQLAGIRLPAVNNPASGAAESPEYRYTFDDHGNLMTLRDPLGREKRIFSNEYGQQTRLRLPLGQSVTRAYDGEGRLATLTDAEGQSVEFVYDADGRQVEKKLSDGGPAQTATRWIYDTRNRVASVEDGRGVTELTYSELGRVAGIEKPEGRIDYEYDLAGNVTRIRTANTDTEYAYDILGRLTTVSVAKRGGVELVTPEVSTYVYDISGNVTNLVRGNGTFSTYEYDELNRMTGVSHWGPGDVLLDRHACDRDDLGKCTRRTSTTRTQGGDLVTNTVTYSYDALDRLVRESADSVGTNVGHTIVYMYDLAGNRLRRVVNVGGSSLTTTYGYDANDRLLAETNTLTGAPSERLEAWAQAGTVVTYGYDENGSCVAKTTTGAVGETVAYTYDLESRLVRVERTDTVGGKPRVTRSDFTYDYDGNRTRKLVVVEVDGAEVSREDRQFLVTGQNPSGLPQILDELVDGRPTTSHIIGYRVLGVHDVAEGTAYRLEDPQHSTRLLTDETGAVWMGFEYDAFGVPLDHPGDGLGTRLLYGGQATDIETGLIYLRARYYDPQTGRFTRRDPFGGSIEHPRSSHAYLYADCDPVNRRDETGLFSLTEMLVTIIVQAVVSEIINTLLEPVMGPLYRNAVPQWIWDDLTKPNFTATVYGETGSFGVTWAVSAASVTVGYEAVTAKGKPTRVVNFRTILDAAFNADGPVAIYSTAGFSGGIGFGLGASGGISTYVGLVYHTYYSKDYAGLVLAVGMPFRVLPKDAREGFLRNMRTVSMQPPSVYDDFGPFSDSGMSAALVTLTAFSSESMLRNRGMNFGWGNFSRGSSFTATINLPDIAGAVGASWSIGGTVDTDYYIGGSKSFLVMPVAGQTKGFPFAPKPREIWE